MTHESQNQIFNSIDIDYIDAEGRYTADSLVSQDPRPLSTNKAIDPRALFSLLSFGTVIPPLSPWIGVERLMPGYHYGLSELGVSCQGANKITDLLPFPSSIEKQADAVEHLIDDSLRSVSVPIILFSGGVDSGIIAARAAALGKRETLLLNYCFGPEDSESKLAEAMARILGLRFERIQAGRQSLASSLEFPGAIYPLPFGDEAVPQNGARV